MQLLVLCPLIFLASFVDSIAGGGGLISLSSYNAVGIVGTTSLGTNKFASSIGTIISSANYIRTKNYHLPSLIPSLIGSIAGSALGSRVALMISTKSFSIIMLILTPIVAILTLKKKTFQVDKTKSFTLKQYIIIGLLTGLIVGFYDGFFGPGTGMFLQLGFIAILNLEPVKAAGNARIVNLGSNLAATITFIASKNVLYSIALPCAVASLLGGLTGSQLAIKKEVKIIKPLMLVVLSILFLKVLLDFLGVL